MAMPMANAMLLAYLRRKDNKLGDDLASDFEPPVYFHGRFSDVSKRALFQGALGMGNSQSQIETYDLKLSSCKMRKDDVVEAVGRADDGRLIPDGTRIWRVNSVTVYVERLRLAGPDQDRNQEIAPKAIEVQ